MSEPPIVPDADPGPVVTGWNDSPVTGDRIDVNENSFIAGDPAGARIEIRSTGFHAFNGVGTETAHIDGAEGVFVGGEFRTSDQLPGQVILADDALTTHYDPQPRPGIGITPTSPSGFESLPGIGPSVSGLTIYGGKKSGAGSSLVQAHPESVFLRTMREDGTTAGTVATTTDLTQMQTYREDGSSASRIQATATASSMRTYSGNSVESGWVQVRPQDVELAYVAPNNTYFSWIKADASEASLFTRAGGTNRYLTVDADGIWVKTGAKSYNLEETAQDSGWQSITPDAGYTGSASFAWRNKGGVIWYRGTVTATWAEGWNTIATLPAEVRPAAGYTVNEAGTSAGVLIRTQVDGRLELYAPAAGTSTHRFTSLSYPIG